MDIKSLLKGISYEVVKGSDKSDIGEINYNSREIKEGDVFFCIKGFKTDGHNYADNAVENGAQFIVCEDDVCLDKNVTVIKVDDTRKALAVASSNYYGNPKDKMKIIGVTGTNGKTTITFMLKNVLEEAGYKVGLIGTVANYIGDKKIKSHRTTPESLELHKLFKEMADNGVQYCIMEVSSHSLSLDRVYGVKFVNGIFTNLTQDHLDFHKTMENYFQAKCILFYNSERKIINIDDEYGMRLKDMFENVRTYSIETPSDLRGYNINNTSKGVSYDLNINGELHHIILKMPGKHNVYNSLAVIDTALINGINIECIKKGLIKAKVPGRCELIEHNDRVDFDIVIDYAHTPDGLEKILKSAREFTEKRLICVFGCGGDRDVTKRPIMGRIATELSDIAIVTSDNPRSEEPMSIIEDILKGIPTKNYIVEENRKEAIFKAMKEAKKGDVVVIAGKGHEDYQILKDRTVDFDERVIVKELLDRL